MSLRGLSQELTRRGIAINAKSTGYCGSYEAEAGARFADRLLERKLEVTALVFGNGALAIGFMRVAQQRGIRMPQDLSIVGFDNIPGAAMVWPGLTTVAQPMRDMGRDAGTCSSRPRPGGRRLSSTRWSSSCARARGRPWEGAEASRQELSPRSSQRAPRTNGIVLRSPRTQRCKALCRQRANPSAGAIASLPPAPPAPALRTLR